jgi:serine/threonine protein kinase
MMKPLDSGRHGTVWTTTSSTGRPAAIKMLRKRRQDMRPSDSNRMVLNEIDALQRLKGHAPHVITLEAVREDDDAFLLEMELGQPLISGCFLARLIAHDVAMGLHECHTHGVLHGDVKPGNVVYSPEANLFKLVDFGSSMRIGNNAYLKWGTLQYMAPEVLHDYGAYSTHADVWSLGMLIQDVTRKRGKDKLLTDVAYRCLHPDPEQRPSPLQVAQAIRGSSA